MVPILSWIFILIGFVVFEMHAILSIGIFGMNANGSCQFWSCACAVSRDPYRGEWNVTPYLILRTHFSYSPSKFYGAIIKNNGYFLLTFMLSSSHYRLLEKGFLGVKKGELSRKNDYPGTNVPPIHVLGAFSVKPCTLLMVNCRCVEGTKNISFFII